MNIDAHQHFWQYDPIRDAWINDDMKVIQRDFLPEDLKPILDANDVDGCVAVQADQSEVETEFLLDLAGSSPWVKGVVGWVDLLGDDLSDRLEYFKSNTKFKGLRHILQAEPDGFMSASKFIDGVKTLEKHDLTYDLLITEKQLEETLQLVEKLPVMHLVIDHIAKPDIKNQSFDHWAKYMEQISRFDHVSVKLSGMATEADYNTWKPQDFERYLDFCLEHFGAERLMYGSDWPVCLLAGNYETIQKAVYSYISKLSSEEQAFVMGGTAAKFYDLN